MKKNGFQALISGHLDDTFLLYENSSLNLKHQNEPATRLGQKTTVKYAGKQVKTLVQYIGHF